MEVFLSGVTKTEPSFSRRASVLPDGRIGSLFLFIVKFENIRQWPFHRDSIEEDLSK